MSGPERHSVRISTSELGSPFPIRTWGMDRATAAKAMERAFPQPPGRTECRYTPPALPFEFRW